MREKEKESELEKTSKRGREKMRTLKAKRKG